MIKQYNSNSNTSFKSELSKYINWFYFSFYKLFSILYYSIESPKVFPPFNENKNLEDNQVSPMWKANLIELERLLKKDKLIDVTYNPKVQFAFILNLRAWRKGRFQAQMQYLQNVFSQHDLKFLLKERKNSFPIPIQSIKYQTSQSRVNHLACFHLAESKSILSCNNYYKVILEFGGGLRGVN